MQYTVEHLETSRAKGFEPLDVFRAILKSLLGLNGQDVKLLDCGCGTGFFTRQYAQITGVHANGIDIDDDLLAAAKQIASENNLTIKFEKADICHLPYEDNSFDVVACDIMLEIFDDKSVPIKEMLRVCKPNGKVVCIEPNYQSYVYYDPRIPEEENMRRIRADNKQHAFGPGVTIADAMRKAGLKDIKLVPWLWGGLQDAGITLILSGIDVYIVCGNKEYSQKNKS